MGPTVGNHCSISNYYSSIGGSRQGNCVPLGLFLNMLAIFTPKRTGGKGSVGLTTLPLHFLVCHGAKKNSGADYIKEAQHLK